MKILLRPEEASDIETIFDLNKQAFGRDNEANVVSLLRCKKTFIPALSIVAIRERQLVGHILFTLVEIVDSQTKKNQSLALAPVAVHPDFQNEGIGTQMIKYGLNQAQQLGFKSVMVLGRATYYPRFGFLPASHWHIYAPFDVLSCSFMAMELKPGGLHGVSGIVDFPSEFSMA